MATTYMKIDVEPLQEKIREQIEKRLNEYRDEVINKAVQEFREKLDRAVATAAVDITRMVSMYQYREELRIVVDTSREHLTPTKKEGEA